MGSWKDEYKIGVTIIDNQHKQLFDAYDEFLHKLQENKTKEAKEVLIQRLKQYTLFHFATEERYMKQISFKGLDIHKNEHIYFIEKINSFEKKFNFHLF